MPHASGVPVPPARPSRSTLGVTIVPSCEPPVQAAAGREDPLPRRGSGRACSDQLGEEPARAGRSGVEDVERGRRHSAARARSISIDARRCGLGGIELGTSGSPVCVQTELASPRLLPKARRRVLESRSRKPPAPTAAPSAPTPVALRCPPPPSDSALSRGSDSRTSAEPVVVSTRASRESGLAVQAKASASSSE